MFLLLLLIQIYGGFLVIPNIWNKKIKKKIKKMICSFGIANHLTYI